MLIKVRHKLVFDYLYVYLTSCLSGFPLSTESTEAILALSGKIPWRKQRFIACVKGFAIISAPILISFGGIVSTPTLSWFILGVF